MNSKKFMHDLDPMFTKNYNYYALECDQFPKIYELIKSIPCTDPLPGHRRPVVPGSTSGGIQPPAALPDDGRRDGA